MAFAKAWKRDVLGGLGSASHQCGSPVGWAWFGVREGGDQKCNHLVEAHECRAEELRLHP